METECEYCQREVTGSHKNEHGRIEYLCEQCLEDFERRDELDRAWNEYSCPE